MSQRNEAAAGLRKVLGSPIYNRTLRKEVGHGELDYEVYLRTRDLLALQTPAAALVVPDELMFQVTHQSQELWLKCAAYEIANLVEEIDNDELFVALATLDRIILIARSLSDPIRILSTLTPARFQVIRRSLGNGSGLESPGYNQILAAAEVAAQALDRLFARRTVDLKCVYSDPDRYPDLHRIAERFIDWDSAHQSWLIEHFMLVRRTIGIDKTVKALDGFPTVALGARMTKPLFPDLWNIRVELTREWNREGGFAPGDERVVVTTEMAPITRAPVATLETVRAEFPLIAQCVYLNSNATGAVPRAARRALDEYWRTIETWRDEVWEQWWVDLHAHADSIAQLINAPRGSVVCDASVSVLLARVLSCFRYGERPRIVTSDLEFPSLPFVVRAFARYGAEPVIVPSRDGATIDVEGVVRAIDHRTTLVCLSHATFATGSVLDVAPIVQRAREVGALVALDAYQAIGIMPVDATALDVDFMFGGAHKWLCGSYESAFLYIRPALLPSLEPAATGWIASENPLTFGPPSGWAPDARRFAGGTPAMLPILFSRPGLAIVQELGIETIRKHSLVCTDRLMARADAAGLPVVTPRPHARRGGVVALRFPGDQLVAHELIGRGFVCSYRSGIRIAPHFYNTVEEVDAFMGELVKLAREAS